jgi:hypothetical protein
MGDCPPLCVLAVALSLRACQVPEAQKKRTRPAAKRTEAHSSRCEAH